MSENRFANSYKVLLLGSVLAGFLFSCKKEEEGKDNSKPVINFSSPDDAGRYIYKDTIRIKCRAEDNLALQRFSLRVDDLLGGNIILDLQAAVSDNRSSIDTFYCIDHAEPGILKINTVASDQSGNEAKRELYLHINHHH